MKKRNLLAYVGALVLAGACVPSVHPFYTEKDLNSDPALVGQWIEQDKSDQPQTWNFQNADGKAYKLVVRESGGKEGEFDAHLFKLKGHLFLDLMASNPKLETNQSDIVAASLIAGHLLVQVSQLQPTLSMAFMNPDWLDKYLEEHAAALPHTRIDKRVVLTATTEQLQKFVLEHLGKDELFGDPGQFRKSTEPGKKAASARNDRDRGVF
jgi:hypothetical protein